MKYVSFTFDDGRRDNFTYAYPVARFIEQIPDNTCAVLMLHSILPEDSKHYGTDPWNWSVARFEEFCKEIKKLNGTGRVETATLEQIVNGTFEK